MTTIRDVAKLAGVSTSTVSLTFGDNKRVKPETARRIWDAAQQLGYKPNPVAQSLKLGRSRMVGVVLAEISNPFSGRLIKEIAHTAYASGYHVIVSDTETDPVRELELIDQLSAQRVSGIILTPHGHSAAYIEHVRACGTPIVIIDQKIDRAERDFVGSNTRLAASMLTEHLVNLGHQRIAQITGPHHLWTATERIGGFRDTLAAKGIAVDETLIVNGDYDDEKAYEITMGLMTRPNPPTAILAASNVMALGALQALQDLGLTCPDDVSLATIDDIPWSAVIRPKITMVLQDIETIAQTAIEFLLERIELSDPGAIPSPRERVLTPRMVVGGSTAPPKKQSV